MGGGLAALVLGGLDIWFRIDNLSMLTGESASVGFGLWLALAGGIAVVLAVVGVMIQAARPVPVELPAAGSAPVAPSWAATHRAPADGMPATPRPDPTAEVISTLAGGLPLQTLEIRGD